MTKLRSVVSKWLKDNSLYLGHNELGYPCADHLEPEDLVEIAELARQWGLKSTLASVRRELHSQRYSCERGRIRLR